eukprot:scaffold20075_cov109-Isochrysis_galbana.AAC.4
MHRPISPHLGPLSLRCVSVQSRLDLERFCVDRDDVAVADETDRASHLQSGEGVNGSEGGSHERRTEGGLAVGWRRVTEVGRFLLGGSCGIGATQRGGLPRDGWSSAWPRLSWLAPPPAPLAPRVRRRSRASPPRSARQ